MATVASSRPARTPTAARQATIDVKPHHRSNKTVSRVNEGDTPKLSLPTLLPFVPAARGASASTATAAKSTALQPIGVNATRKRTVADIDLVNTTPPQLLGTEEAQQLPPSTKRARVNNAAATAQDTLTANKSKQAKIKRAERQQELVAQSIHWRAKYKAAFPTFTFYFDALDAATEHTVIKAVERLGASVDTFFSKKVTHVVTTRAIPPAALGKENTRSPVPSQSFTRGANDSAAGPSRTAKANPPRSPAAYTLLSGQKLRGHGDGLEKNPFIDAQDILSKAVDFGLKTWSLDKLQSIISRINARSPSGKVDAQRNTSLPALLRDEQLYGTRERDPFVPRADTHYFKKYFLLVEDSTGEHRPIVTKEYERPTKNADPQWPVLWGGCEGRGAFYHYHGQPKYTRRLPTYPTPAPRFPATAKAPAARKSLTNNGGHALAAARALAPNAAPSLRRAVSMQGLNRANAKMTADQGPNDGYIAASGNSQIITSTNATSTRSGAPSQWGANGAMIDKRLAVLSKRSVPLGKSFMSGASNAPKLKRSVSMDAGLNAQVPPPRDEPKKPGYCENCRVKYDDFKVHVVSGKHRRFAQNDENWEELDELLLRVKRQRVKQPSKPESYSYYLDDDTDEEERAQLDREEAEAEDSGFFEQEENGSMLWDPESTLRDPACWGGKAVAARGRSHHEEGSDEEDGEGSEAEGGRGSDERSESYEDAEVDQEDEESCGGCCRDESASED